MVLVSYEDLIAVGMRRAQKNRIMGFQTTINILHNMYGVIIDLNRYFQLFNAKFVENIVIALNKKIEYIGFKFRWL